MKSQNNLKKKLWVHLLAAAIILLLCSCKDVAVDSTYETTDTIVKEITVEIIHSDGKSVSYSYCTEKETLRQALEEKELIYGDESTYGLYVKIVDGEEADYDKNKTYWAFYKNNEYMTHGVDSEMIGDGDHYQIVFCYE